MKSLIWIISIVAVVALGAAFVPPFISFDEMRPQIENAVFNQTGRRIKISGGVRLSLLGRAMLNAESVQLDDIGFAKNLQFQIKFSDLLDMRNARITGNFGISGAALKLDSLQPLGFPVKISIANSSVQFLGKNYEITEGTLRGNEFNGTVRTDEHKYYIHSIGSRFHIENNNVNLKLDGALNDAGGASGHISIETDKINEWFAFALPRIAFDTKLESDFAWDGFYGIEFSDIRGRSGNADFSGRIKIGERREISMNIANWDFDSGFLTAHPEFLHDADLDIRADGRIKFAGKIFSKFNLQSSGENDRVIIKNLTASNAAESLAAAGVITANGAQSAKLELMTPELYAKCDDFSGTPDDWNCAAGTIRQNGDTIHGSLKMRPDSYDLRIYSLTMIADKNLINRAETLGRNGKILFDLQNAAGSVIIKNGTDYLLNISLPSAKLADWGISFFNFDSNAAGKLDAVIENGRAVGFSFSASDWTVSQSDAHISFRHDDFAAFIKTVFPGIETFILGHDMPLEIRGDYDGRMVRDGRLKIGTQEFDFTANKNEILLQTVVLDLDKLLDQNYFANYESLKFTMDEPLFLPFALDKINMSVSAGILKINDISFNKFIYALVPGKQTISITDSARGNILAVLRHTDKNNYAADISFNKFLFSGKLLNDGAALNLTDTFATGKVSLTTYGWTSNDARYNASGDLDIEFSGGILDGIGTDYLYANIMNASQLTLPDLLYAALNGGRSELKSLVIRGDYSGSQFTTTDDFILRLNNATMRGAMRIANGRIAANMALTLNNSASVATPINLQINPNGTRGFADAINSIDLGFMQARTLLQ
ncbi:MAG: hypothetical protein LBO08_03070 [Rickettsiales bacterium]|jgi:hypothetical protein|nr:hypothetical protein [Rickettsiales bacterium]